MNQLMAPKAADDRFLGYLTRHLGQQELRRRLWHFLPGFLAFGLATVPRMETVRLWVMVLIVVFGIFLPAVIAVFYQRAFRRHRDEDIVPSIFGYVLPLSLLCLLFRSHVEIPLTVAAIIAFGDGSATLVGLLTRGPRIPWNPRKSWAGCMAFVVAGTTLSTLVYWTAAYPQASFDGTLLSIAPVVALCAFLETLPLRVNDNITIGCSAAILMTAMQMLTIG